MISGTFRLGMGETADRSKAKAFAPGSFIALSPGMAHFAGADDDNTVVQLNSTGPWTQLHQSSRRSAEEVADVRNSQPIPCLLRPLWLRGAPPSPYCSGFLSPA